MELVAPSDRYRRSYLEAERELVAAGEPGSALAFDEHVRALAAQQALIERWLVVADDYLGKLHLRPSPEPWQGHLGVKVRPCHRRRGLALHMIELGIRELVGRGIDGIHVTCAPSNAASLALIARIGGVLIDDVATPDGDPMRRFSIATAIRPSV